jgi:hypothetical protein
MRSHFSPPLAPSFDVRPIRIVAFNTSEGWAQDVSEDVESSLTSSGA